MKAKDGKNADKTPVRPAKDTPAPGAAGADREPGAGREAAPEERPAAHPHRHRARPRASAAARWIAARILW